jgi:hypothetical protein
MRMMRAIGRADITRRAKLTFLQKSHLHLMAHAAGRASADSIFIQLMYAQPFIRSL